MRRCGEDDIAACSVKHLSTLAQAMQQTSSCTRATSVCPQASDRSGAGAGILILPHLTTLIIQDLGLVPGTGAGGHTTLGDLKCIYNYTIFSGHFINILFLHVPGAGMCDDLVK